METKAAQLQKVQGELDEMHKEHSVRVLAVTTPSGVLSHRAVNMTQCVCLRASRVVFVF